MSAISLRAARSSDAAALGALHVASWRETYAGLLPDAMLRDLSADARSAMWRAIVDDPAGFDGTAIFVAEDEGGIVGFGACGEQRDVALRARGFDGEIGAIYILRLHQLSGLGAALMGRMGRDLLDRGRTAATLWVLRENVAARAFYARLGGAIVGERTSELAGTTMHEVAYGWRSLARLVRPPEA